MAETNRTRLVAESTFEKSSLERRQPANKPIQLGTTGTQQVEETKPQTEKNARW